MQFYAQKSPPRGSWRGTKLLLVMKLSFAIVFITSLQLSAATYGQKVNLRYNREDMATVLKDLQRQTGFNLAGKYDLILAAKPVTMRVDSVDLKTALRLLEQGQELRLSVIGKSISVVERFGAIDSPNKYIDTNRNQGEVIRGVVLGEGDVPLPDVTIQNLRTGRGTITNATGEFVIRDVILGDNLLFSYIGYTARNVDIRDVKFKEIRLELAANDLDEVQIEGYRRTSKRFSASNVVTVKADEIERQPVSNPLQALQGKVPGLTVTQTSGSASAPFKVELRGRSTIDPKAVPEPLFIVDGVPLKILNLGGNDSYNTGSTGFNQSGIVGPVGGQSPLWSLNPDDIESITVLKDAGATAIYGSIGGQGVILITTKRGKPGRARLTASINRGSSYVGRFFPMLNTKEYLEMRREAFRNDSVTPDISNAYDLLAPSWDTTKYTDWQKMFFGGWGERVEANFSLSGGDKNTSFRVSGSYFNQKPINSFKGSDQRIASTSSITHNSINRKLLFSLSNYFSFAKSDIISLSGSTITAPNAPPIFDESGKLNYLGWVPATDYFTFSNLLTPYDSKTLFINNGASLSYTVIKGLRATVNFGYSMNWQRQYMVFPIASKDPRYPQTGSAQSGSNDGNRIVVEPQVEYLRFIGKGELTALFGGTYQSIKQASSNAGGYGFTNDQLLRSLGNSAAQSAGSSEGQYKYSAMFGRLSYLWRKKITLELTGRRDGSSRFAAGRNFGTFYSGGLSYIFSEESFFRKKLPFISFGKIRGTYGETGSDMIQDYKYLTRWTGAGYQPYMSNSVYVPTQHANPYLRWQKDRKLDASLQFGFVRNTINVEIGWYRNTASNQLLDFILPNMTGFPFVTSNFPATVRNEGWEFNVSTRIVETKEWMVEAGINGGFNKNKLVSYPGIESSPYAAFYKVGEPLNIRKVFHFIGVNPQSGEYTYEDINKSGVLESDLSAVDGDYIYKDISIKCDGGAFVNARFKQLQLNLGLQYRIRDGQSAFYQGTIPGLIGNQPKYLYDNRWRRPGDNAKFARLTTIPRESDNIFYQSDGIYTNANFLRLNNISISYDLGKRILNKLKLRELNMYVQAQNLFVFTNYKGSDPEVMNFGGISPLSIITYGIKLSF